MRCDRFTVFTDSLFPTDPDDCDQPVLAGLTVKGSITSRIARLLQWYIVCLLNAPYRKYSYCLIRIGYPIQLQTQRHVTSFECRYVVHSPVGVSIALFIMFIYPV